MNGTRYSRVVLHAEGVRDVGRDGVILSRNISYEVSPDEVHSCTNLDSPA